jgi:hypothetical protein
VLPLRTQSHQQIQTKWGSHSNLMQNDQPHKFKFSSLSVFFCLNLNFKTNKKKTKTPAKFHFLHSHFHVFVMMNYHETCSSTNAKQYREKEYVFHGGMDLDARLRIEAKPNTRLANA